MEHKFVLFILIILMRRCWGCVETFRDPLRSTTVCSNVAHTCTVTCNSDYFFFDGNQQKQYICNEKDEWTPPVHKIGCLSAGNVYRIKLSIAYTTESRLRAILCYKIHNDELDKLKDDFNTEVTNLCNTVTDIARIKSIYSDTNSIITTLDILIDNISTGELQIQKCALALENRVKNKSLFPNKLQLNCTNQETNVTLSNDKAFTEISMCMLKKDQKISKYYKFECEAPIVGVHRFAFTGYETSDVILSCEISFGRSFATSVYWTFNSKRLNIDSKYCGSTVHNPSLLITNISYDDEGTYICFADGDYGTGSSFSVTLSVVKKTTNYDTKMSDIGNEALIGVSVVAGFGWILVIVLVLFIIRKKRTFGKKSNGAMDYVDLTERTNVQNQTPTNVIPTVNPELYHSLHPTSAYIHANMTKVQ